MPRRPVAGWWAWVVIVAFTAINVALTTMIAGSLADRAVQADRRAREEAGRQSRGVVCLVIRTQENVFSGSDDDIDRKAAQAWHDLGILFQCY